MPIISQEISAAGHRFQAKFYPGGITAYGGSSPEGRAAFTIRMLGSEKWRGWCNLVFNVDKTPATTAKTVAETFQELQILDLGPDYTIPKLKLLLRNGTLKVLISFGGGGIRVTSRLMGVKINRKNLINNIIKFMKTHNLDGFDCDWKNLV